MITEKDLKLLDTPRDQISQENRDRYANLYKFLPIERLMSVYDIDLSDDPSGKTHVDGRVTASGLIEVYADLFYQGSYQINSYHSASTTKIITPTDTINKETGGAITPVFKYTTSTGTEFIIEPESPIQRYTIAQDPISGDSYFIHLDTDSDWVRHDSPKGINNQMNGTDRDEREKVFIQDLRETLNRQRMSI